MCEWPTDNSGPNGFSISISWAELVFAISDLLGAWILVRRHDSEGNEILLPPMSMAQALAQAVTTFELCYNMQQIFWQVVALIPQQTVPEHLQGGKNNSLLLQGQNVWTTGFSNSDTCLSSDAKLVKQGTPNSLIECDFENSFLSWAYDLESCKLWEKRCKLDSAET